MDAEILKEIICGESNIFANREVFEMTYIPDIYNYRDVQLNVMTAHSQAISDNIAPKNLHLTGGNATGKTSTLKLFLGMLDDAFDNVITVYVNCQLTNTENMVYGEIFRKVVDEKENLNGKTNNKLFKKIIEKIIAERKILVLGLDDYDNFKTRDGLNKLLYNFLRIHEKEPEAQVSIITASIMKDLALEPSVESIFERITILFDQYSYPQMYHILKDRCEFGFRRDVIDDDMIMLAARKAYNAGNLRHGIRLLSSAGEKAEMAGSTKIIEEFFD